MATRAHQLHALLREIDSISPEQDYSDAIGWLYTHARRWAQHQDLSFSEALAYAAWFVDQYGERWAREYDGPNHFDAYAAYSQEMVS